MVTRQNTYIQYKGTRTRLFVKHDNSGTELADAVVRREWAGVAPLILALVASTAVVDCCEIGISRTFQGYKGKF